ncbi:MAG: hypothetical protein JSV01_04065, partial [Desulfobacterales bacterium]
TCRGCRESSIATASAFLIPVLSGLGELETHLTRGKRTNLDGMRPLGPPYISYKAFCCIWGKGTRGGLLIFGGDASGRMLIFRLEVPYFYLYIIGIQNI